MSNWQDSGRNRCISHFHMWTIVALFAVEFVVWEFRTWAWICEPFSDGEPWLNCWFPYLPRQQQNMVDDIPNMFFDINEHLLCWRERNSFKFSGPPPFVVGVSLPRFGYLLLPKATLKECTNCAFSWDASSVNLFHKQLLLGNLVGSNSCFWEVVWQQVAWELRCKWSMAILPHTCLCLMVVASSVVEVI